MVVTIKLSSTTNGIIWPKKPLINSTGLISCLKNIQYRTNHKRSAIFRSVAFPIKSNNQIFAATDEKGHVFIFNVKTNRYSLIHHLGIPSLACAFSPNKNNELIITCENTLVKVLNIQTHTLTSTLKGHRCPATNISVQEYGHLALTASRDSVILWDSNDWTRFRTLHHGPDVEFASFAFPKSTAVAACFDNETILFWNLQSFQQVYRLEVPEHEEPPGLRRFTISADGSMAVATGRNSFLYLWNISSETLIRIIELPSRISLIQQISFLPGSSTFHCSSTTLSILGDDGRLNFLNINSKTPQVGLQINAFPKLISMYHMDMYGKYLLSGTSDGCLLLHDLDISREFARQIEKKNNQLGEMNDKKEQPLSARSAFAVCYQKSNSSQQNSDDEDNESETDLPNQTPSSKLVDNIFGVAKKQFKSDLNSKNYLNSSKIKNMKHKNIAINKAVSVFHLAKLTEKDIKINHSRLKMLLKTYGQYPSKYRLLIWRFLLRLPENNEAFLNLCSKGDHIAFIRLREKYPLQNQRLSKRLLRVLSALTHWCPVLGETTYLPALSFPFVKMFSTDDLSAFETCMSIILHWGKDWFQTFPHPPLNVLSRFESFLSSKDSQLYKHFVKLKITSQVYLWSILRTGFTELLAKDDWLRLWDHFFTYMKTKDDLLYAAVYAYIQYFRISLLSSHDSYAIEQFFHQQNAIDINRLLELMYKISQSPDWKDHFGSSSITTATLSLKDSNPTKPSINDDNKDLKTFWPLNHGQYPIFQQYPKTIVNFQLKERERIAFEEKEILEKRQLLQDLEVRTTKLQEQHERWKEQNATLREIEEKRRMEKVIEGKRRLSERKIMEERARQRRLQQCLALEQQAKETFLHQIELRDTETLRMKEEYDLQKENEEYEIQSRQQEEKLCKMEFETMQRIKKMQQEKLIQERFEHIREEMVHKMKEEEFLQKKQQIEWEKEDEYRRVKSQIEIEKKQRELQVQNEIKFQDQLNQEYQSKHMNIQIERLKVQRERQLRILQEEKEALLEKEINQKRQADQVIQERNELQKKIQEENLIQEQEEKELQRRQLFEKEKEKYESEIKKRQESLVEISNEQKKESEAFKLRQIKKEFEHEDLNEKDVLTNTIHQMKEYSNNISKNEGKSRESLNTTNNNSSPSSSVSSVSDSDQVYDGLHVQNLIDQYQEENMNSEKGISKDDSMKVDEISFNEINLSDNDNEENHDDGNNDGNDTDNSGVSIENDYRENNEDDIQNYDNNNDNDDEDLGDSDGESVHSLEQMPLLSSSGSSVSSSSFLFNNSLNSYLSDDSEPKLKHQESIGKDELRVPAINSIPKTSNELDIASNLSNSSFSLLSVSQDLPNASESSHNDQKEN